MRIVAVCFRPVAMLTFAGQCDPPCFHANETTAAGPIFDQVIVSGADTMAPWRRFDDEIAHDVGRVRGMEGNGVRVSTVLRAANEMPARAAVLAKRPSGKRPRRGVAAMRRELVNQRPESVSTCRSAEPAECRRGRAEDRAETDSGRPS